jgi:hypothetical protein
MLAVRESMRSLAVGDPADDLVAELREHEQTELTRRVPIPLR